MLFCFRGFSPLSKSSTSEHLSTPSFFSSYLYYLSLLPPFFYISLVFSFLPPLSLFCPPPRHSLFSQTSFPVIGRPVGRVALLTDDEFQDRAGRDPPSLHSSMTTTLNHKFFFTPHPQWHVYFILSLLWISSRWDMCIKSSGTVLCKNLFQSDLHAHTNI